MDVCGVVLCFILFSFFKNVMYSQVVVGLYNNVLSSNIMFFIVTKILVADFVLVFDLEYTVSIYYYDHKSPNHDIILYSYILSLIRSYFTPPISSSRAAAGIPM